MCNYDCIMTMDGILNTHNGAGEVFLIREIRQSD